MLRSAEAVLLGLVQGPTELLPVSSSGHVAVLPWLLGWSSADAEPELRKSLEVALHAGTAVALLIGLREEVGEAIGALDSRRLGLAALSVLPPAVAGLAFERIVEERLGTPRTVAAGLVLGSVLLVGGDRAPQRRGHEEAGWIDALSLGVAQAAALMPGVSRNGATLAAARARGFRRVDANVLSRHCALPVIVGAGVLKGSRLARGSDGAGSGSDGVGVPLAAGALASFGSTLASIRLIGLVERDRPLAWWAAYRCLAAFVILAHAARRGTVRAS